MDRALLLPSPGPPLAFATRVHPVVDPPHFCIGAGDSHDGWDDAFQVAWDVVLVLLVLGIVVLLSLIFCGRCILDSIRSSYERFRSSHLVMRVLNWNSGQDYGAFGNGGAQSLDSEDSRGSAAPEEAGQECAGTPETHHRRRTESETTLEADDAV